MNLIEQFNKMQLKAGLPQIRPGDTVRVYQKIKEGSKERIQVFEGVVIAKKHGKGISSTITVRKVVEGVGIERVFPVNSPVINKIEVVRSAKVRRAKLYYLRTAKGKKARLKRKDFVEAIAKEETEEPQVSELQEGQESQDQINENKASQGATQDNESEVQNDKENKAE